MEVSTKHQFQDEWFAKALLDYQIIEKDFIDELRARFADHDYFMDVLIDNDHLKEDDITVFIENVLQIPFVNLDEMQVNSNALNQIPENICDKYQVFPFNMREDHIAVAFINPFDLEAEKEIAYLTGKFVKTFFAFRKQVKRKIEEFYSPDKFIDNLVDRANIEKSVQFADDNSEQGKSSVVKLVSLIIGDAIEQEASDIHVEPKDKLVAVRYRVDGILRNILEVPKSVHASLVSRIKIISNLNIAESRKPQDGKAKVIHDETDIDLRISILPTNFGEKVVIRILDNRKAKVSFQQLGIRGRNLELLNQCFTKTQGMILVTGPTGSGKTTTLYAALNRIRNTTNNILTIEDPIEYMMENVNQVQVNEKAGITFASALRSFLRQDPDVILVGEIRDQQTAEIGIQASLTGHLVLSTLHTNDSLGAITRMSDMGVDIYKVASSLEAVIAQRLVRMLCSNCKTTHQPDDVEKKLVPFISQLGLKPKFYHGPGCQKCGYTGYKGRIAVYEILMIDDELKDLIGSGASIHQIRKKAKKKGFVNLYEDALKHIAEGNTDYKEVLRVISPGDMENDEQAKDAISEKLSGENLENLNKNNADSKKVSKSSKDNGSINSNSESGNGEIDDHNENKPTTVLLVEDSSGMRKMVRILVDKKTDWKLLEAEDGVKALELINKEKPDAIVLDIMMPKMDGYEFLQHLRDNLSTAAIPVMVLTALSGSENEVKSFNLGADDYISKPYNPHVLLARIKRMLLRSKNGFTEKKKEKKQTSNLNLKLV